MHDRTQTIKTNVGNERLKCLCVWDGDRVPRARESNGRVRSLGPDGIHTGNDCGAGILVGGPRRRYNRVMAATLSSRERAQLKARAHSLNPVVRIGQAGVTPKLTAEVDRALTAHEVIKVSIAVEDRAERHALGEALAERVDATPVHRVGKILILWRRRAEDS